MSTTQQLSREAPPPAPDLDSAPFWEGVRAHRLMVQACSACGRVRFPPMPGCPYCGQPDGSWVEVSGDGTVYSWIRVHRTSNLRFADAVPYVVATIELAAGCRLVAQLDSPHPVAIGSAVQPVYLDHEAWTELRFRSRANGDVDG